MKTIIQLSKTAILFVSVCFMSCMDGKESNSSQFPQTTSKMEFRKPFTAEMVETSNGIIVNNDGSITHVGVGGATLISKIIQPSFSTFHTGSIVYIINEKSNYAELVERLLINFRLTMDSGESWTEWNDDIYTLLSTEGEMSDNEPDSLFIHLLSGSHPERLYNGVEIKIVSNEINQGKKIIDLINFNFGRKSTEWFEKIQKSKKEGDQKKKRQK